MNRDVFVFLKAWARSPRKVGAIIPSSPVLARAMAAQVTPAPGKIVVELGAGTGAVTRALLARGINIRDLIVIESDPVFCRRLRQLFPDIHIFNADATRLEQVFKRHQIQSIDTIVSSLPLLSIDRRSQARILEQSFRLLGSHGTFVQYTYSVGSPVRSSIRRRFSVKGHRVSQIWRNVPPATVWRYNVK